MVPLCAMSLSAKPHSPSKHSHAPARGPSIGAYVGIQAPNGYIVVEEPVLVSSGSTVVNTPVAVSEPVLSELSVWQGEQELLVRDGQFFKNTPEGLVWVEQPVGALTRSLPEDATSIWYQDIEYFDVDGILFRKTPNGYKVVDSPWEAAS